MSNLGKGMIAGFAATVVLSVLMVLKQMTGLMPELNPIGMLTSMAGASSPIVGRIMHFIIGSVLWGGLFALVAPNLPGGHIGGGMIFATGAWVLMMIAVMPMAGAGLFGLGIGMAAPVMALMLHLVFGAVLGWVYDLQLQRRPAPA
ncbi:MAG: DUF6789 family protein [Geminicoccaceae bacterium]